MASYGIVGINPDSLKVIRDMQQFKNVSVYDKYKTSLTPFKNVKMQPTVSDLTLNMDGPRTIATFIKYYAPTHRVVRQRGHNCEFKFTKV